MDTYALFSYNYGNFNISHYFLYTTLRLQLYGPIFIAFIYGKSYHIVKIFLKNRFYIQKLNS